MAKRSKSFITRRSFVRKTGIVAAASALGCSVGCGTGFFIKAGANNDGIHNGGPGAGVPADPGLATPGIQVPARGSNVSLSNFELNGNRGNGHNGNSTTGMVQGGAAAWYVGINLMNLDNITLEN